jgi:CARDB
MRHGKFSSSIAPPYAATGNRDWLSQTLRKAYPLKEVPIMSLNISTLQNVIVLAVLTVAASPASLFAGGRPAIRNILQRPRAFYGASLGVSALAPQLPLRRGRSCGESAIPMAEQVSNESAPVDAEPVPAATPVESTDSPPVVTEARGADLALENVKLFEDATVVAGPAYSVRYRNHGVQPSGKFTVAVIASLDGQLQQNAPRVVMEVNALYPGEMQELVLRLPRCQFRYLIVMIDAKGAVNESDESNNSAVLERAAL